jgi:hypothetical protein
MPEFRAPYIGVSPWHVEGDGRGDLAISAWVKARRSRVD